MHHIVIYCRFRASKGFRTRNFPHRKLVDTDAAVHELVEEWRRSETCWNERSIWRGRDNFSVSSTSARRFVTRAFRQLK